LSPASPPSAEISRYLARYLVRPRFQPTRTTSQATLFAEERKMTPATQARTLAHMVVLAVAMSCASTGFASPASINTATPSHDRAATRAPMLVAQASSADPKTGESAAKDACETPREYVKLINSGRYDAIGGLFADDAVYMGPDGKTRKGMKEIGEFYQNFLGPIRLQLRAASYIQEGNNCLVELENKDKKSGRYDLISIDHFIIDPQGKVSKFIVYLRPGTQFRKQVDAAMSKGH
jgi:SnoaL-like domain